MKQIKLFIFAIILSVGASATSFQEHNENWLQGRETPKDPQRIGKGSSDPNVETPIGEGLLLMTALVGGYAVLRRKTMRRRN